MLLYCLLLVLFACNRQPHSIPDFKVSKVLKSDSGSIINVHVNNRMTAVELLWIAGKLKTDSTAIKNLVVHYLLPGNTDLSAGDNSYYASAKFVAEQEAKPADTLKDNNGNIFRIKIFGLSQAMAWKLLTLKPKEVAGKNVLGRFIDDYNHTVIIPFTDNTDKKNSLYIIELDSTAKVVSATVPQKINDDGVEKWLVTPGGDYMVLKNNVLGLYGANGLGVPFNSIKSGI